MILRPSSRLAGLAAALAAAALLARAGWTGERLASGSQSIERSAVDAGGSHESVSPSHGLGSALGEEAVWTTAGSTASSASHLLGPALLNILSFPGTVTDFAEGGLSTTTGLSLQWTAPGYDGLEGALGPGTSFFIRLTSDPGDGFEFASANLKISTQGVSPGAAVSTMTYGLLPNTTYFAQLWTLDAAGNLSFASNRATMTTLAPGPGFVDPPFIGVHVTSISARWTPVSSAGYRLEASSTNFGALGPGGVVYSSESYSAAAEQLTVGADEPLDAATTYYLRVGALNWALQPNYLVLGSTRTRLEPRVPALAEDGFPAVSSYSITVAWDSNGNAPGTIFTLEASTRSDFGGHLFSSSTFADSFELFQLARNTTYYFQVRASTQGSESAFLNLGSTATLTAPPETFPPELVAVFESSASVRWSHGDNPPDVSSYTLRFGNAVLASTRPAGAVPAATITGLVPNTTYQPVISALNWNRMPSVPLVLESTVTFAAQPGAPAGLLGVAFSSASVFWSSDNPLGFTTFTVVLSSSPSYPNSNAGNVELSTVPSPSAASFEGLALNSTYFAFAAARDHAGRQTAFAALGSTATLAAVPEAAAEPFLSVAENSMRLAWSGAGNPPGTLYSARLNGASSATLNLEAEFSALSPNTTYQAQVAAYSHHHGTWTAFAALGSTATLANAPADPGSAMRAVHFTSASVVWLPNGNPLGITSYTAVLTPESFYPNEHEDTVALTTAPAGSLAGATFTGLNSNTLYHLFVAAVNHNGVPSAFVSLGSERTQVSPKTWTGGGGNSSWHNAANWDPSGVPTPTDSVTIAMNATVTADAGAPAISFSSLTLGSPAGSAAAVLSLSTGTNRAGSVLVHPGASLVQGSTQMLRFDGDFTVRAGGRLSHAAVTTDPHNAALDLTVTGTFELQSGAAINLDGAGFRGGALGNPSQPGMGPGGGSGTGTNNTGGGGGGHGGAGGAGTGGGGGAANDNAAAPALPGSGGGGGRATGNGGPGGGLVRIAASSMAVHGWIDASGWAGQGGNGPGGGGAGGGVRLFADFFSGTGVIISSGGAGGGVRGGGGGGGLISVGGAAGSRTCDLTFSVLAGTSAATAGQNGIVTRADAVPAPANFAGAALSASAIEWSWSLAFGATNYQIFSATGGPISPLLGAVGRATTAGLQPNTTASFFVRAMGCGAFADSAAFSAATLAAEPAAAAVPFPAVFEQEISAAWSANGNPIGVTSYTVALSPEPAYPNANPLNVVLASTAPAGGAPTASLAGLEPFTTYYLFVSAVNHAGVETSFVALGSTSTLASPVGTLSPSVAAVFFDSATVRWTPLGAGQSAGYVVEASSTDFGQLAPGGVIRSSATPNGSADRLTVDGLELENTYYFRIGALNWNSVPNFVAAERLNLQVTPSVQELSFGTIDATLYLSTVAVSSVVVSNVGNIPVSLAIFGSTATPASPWSLDVSSGIERVVLQGLWNSVRPEPGEFSTPITGSTRTSAAAGAYAGDQSGALIPVGEQRTFWLKFWLPTSTAVDSRQDFRIELRPVFP